MTENNNIIDTIDSPDDLKKLDFEKMGELAEEIRKLILDTVAANGGHLAPNLGVVELTMALHYVFDTPKDKLVWDVGHQGYVHKILTGRREFFKTLRRYKGCLGFLSREESEYDCFGAGHAGTAISAALGMAVASERRNAGEKVVAIVGDGSLNCGISLEGLNNVRENCRNLIIVLNDNKMSISENVGAIPSYLNRIISGRSYNRFKALTKMMLNKLPHHEEIRRKIQRLEEATKSMFLPGVFFEELGIRYIGPINGHDLPELIRTFEGVKQFHRPVLVHVITEKGRGYSPAVDAPEKFHGLAAFDPETGMSNGVKGLTFSKALGQSMIDLAEMHDDTVAITAAMSHGTGLHKFAEKFPDRLFDVGIAEEHAAVFAGGLASSGIRPVVAMYATFMQRALDCLFHDVCLQNLPVIFCLDRSGIVEDGPTHHGIHDLSFMRGMPNLTVMAPRDENELRSMLFAAYDLNSPVVIRYPRGGSGQLKDLSSDAPENIPVGKAQVLRNGKDGAIWAVGREVWTAMNIAAVLEQQGVELTVVNARFIRPFDAELLKGHAAKMPVFSIEDCQIKGGLASEIDEQLINFKHIGVLHFGWGTGIVPHGATKSIRSEFGLSDERIAEAVSDFLNK
jgi:1-deoxy-D-xylulose-5-phosphate synthase